MPTHNHPRTPRRHAPAPTHRKHRKHRSPLGRGVPASRAEGHGLRVLGVVPGHGTPRGPLGRGVPASGLRVLDVVPGHRTPRGLLGRRVPMGRVRLFDQAGRFASGGVR
jgi:hypothetical protein